MLLPEVIIQTEDYFVINKPAGMAVEPPSHEPTLRDWLIENKYIKVGEWTPESRYGVVHRLDTDTSGVLIWAKNPTVQASLKLLWQGRQVEKTYIALVVGECQSGGVIELPIERDNKNDRQRVVLLGGTKARPAITRYGREEIGSVAGQIVSLVTAEPITGRTHQIRVHFKAIDHPIIGDKLYGEKATDAVARQLGLERQFLHALQIRLPVEKTHRGDFNKDYVCYLAPLAADLRAALKKTNINYQELVRRNPHFFA